jgi:hypothetical protein
MVTIIDSVVVIVGRLLLGGMRIAIISLFHCSIIVLWRIISEVLVGRGRRAINKTLTTIITITIIHFNIRQRLWLLTCCGHCFLN